MSRQRRENKKRNNAPSEIQNTNSPLDQALVQLTNNLLNPKCLKNYAAFIKSANSFANYCVKNGITRKQLPNYIGINKHSELIEFVNSKDIMAHLEYAATAKNSSSKFALSSACIHLLNDPSMSAFENYKIFCGYLFNGFFDMAKIYLENLDEETRKDTLTYSMPETGNNIFHMLAVKASETYGTSNYSIYCHAVKEVVALMLTNNINIDETIHQKNNYGQTLIELYDAIGQRDPKMLFTQEIALILLKHAPNSSMIKVELEPLYNYLTNNLDSLFLKNDKGQTQIYRDILNLNFTSDDLTVFKKTSFSEKEIQSLFLDAQDINPLCYFLTASSDQCTQEMVETFIDIMGPWVLKYPNEYGVNILYESMLLGNRSLFNILKKSFETHFPDEKIETLLKRPYKGHFISPFEETCKYSIRNQPMLQPASFEMLCQYFPEYLQTLYPKVLQDGFSFGKKRILPFLKDIHLDLHKPLERKILLDTVLDYPSQESLKTYFSMLTEEDNWDIDISCQGIDMDNISLTFSITPKNQGTYTSKSDLSIQVNDETFQEINMMLKELVQEAKLKKNDNTLNNLAFFVSMLLKDPYKLKAKSTDDASSFEEISISNEDQKIKKGTKKKVGAFREETLKSITFWQKETPSEFVLSDGLLSHKLPYEKNIRNIMKGENAYLIVPETIYMNQILGLKDSFYDAEDLQKILLKKHLSFNPNCIKRLDPQKKIKTRSQDQDITHEIKIGDDERILLSSFSGTDDLGNPCLFYFPVSIGALHKPLDKKNEYLSGSINLDLIFTRDENIKLNESKNQKK